MEEGEYVKQPTCAFDSSHKCERDKLMTETSRSVCNSDTTKRHNFVDNENRIHPLVPNSFVQIFYDHLEFCERCGEGTFGSVYRALWLSQENKEVAVKKINILDKEAHVLSVLSHRNIIQFFGACTKEPNFCIVTEYAPYGSLFDFLASANDTQLEINQLLSWSRDIALGMNYLHEEAPVTVVHRDLKSKNVVICNDFILKICDFGASRFLGNTAVMTITGTYPWMAPELIQGLPTCELCDVYSFGVVLWELLTRQVPFSGLQGFQIAWVVVEKSERPLIPKSCPMGFADLMRRCWTAVVVNRPTFSDIISYLNVIMNDENLQDDINTFVSDKDNWMQELELKQKEIHKQEQELKEQKEKLREREARLKAWEKKLQKEFKSHTLIGFAQHHKKFEKIKCKISGSGEGTIDSIKDVLSHIMSQNTSYKNTNSSWFDTSPNFVDSNSFHKNGSQHNDDVLNRQNFSMSTSCDSLTSHPTKDFSLCAVGSSSIKPQSRCQDSNSKMGSKILMPKNEHRDSVNHPQIDSKILYENSECDKKYDIFAKSDSVFSENAGSNLEYHTTENVTDNNKSTSVLGLQRLNSYPHMIQKQISTSSEEYNFEGSKGIRCVTNDNKQVDDMNDLKIEKWESAKGDAKVNRTNENFEISSDAGGCISSRPPPPFMRKLKAHHSSPNLFFNATRPQAKGIVTIPLPRDIQEGLKSMKNVDIECLGENFAQDLSEALKRVYRNQSKTSENVPPKRVSHHNERSELPASPKLQVFKRRPRESLEEPCFDKNIAYANSERFCFSPTDKSSPALSTFERACDKPMGFPEVNLKALATKQNKTRSSSVDRLRADKGKCVYSESLDSALKNNKSSSEHDNAVIPEKFQNYSQSEDDETFASSTRKKMHSGRRDSCISNSECLARSDFKITRKDHKKRTDMVQTNSGKQYSSHWPMLHENKDNLTIKPREPNASSSESIMPAEKQKSIEYKSIEIFENSSINKLLKIQNEKKNFEQCWKKNKIDCPDEAIMVMEQRGSGMLDYCNKTMKGSTKHQHTNSIGKLQSRSFTHYCDKDFRSVPNCYRRYYSDSGINSAIPHSKASDLAIAEPPFSPSLQAEKVLFKTFKLKRSFSIPGIRASIDLVKAGQQCNNVKSLEQSELHLDRSPPLIQEDINSYFSKRNPMLSVDDTGNNFIQRSFNASPVDSSFPSLSTDSGCSDDGRCSGSESSDTTEYICANTNMDKTIKQRKSSRSISKPPTSDLFLKFNNNKYRDTKERNFLEKHLRDSTNHSVEVLINKDPSYSKSLSKVSYSSNQCDQTTVDLKNNSLQNEVNDLTSNLNRNISYGKRNLSKTCDRESLKKRFVRDAKVLLKKNLSFDSNTDIKMKVQDDASGFNTPGKCKTLSHTFVNEVNPSSNFKGAPFMRSASSETYTINADQLTHDKKNDLKVSHLLSSLDYLTNNLHLSASNNSNASNLGASRNMENQSSIYEADDYIYIINLGDEIQDLRQLHHYTFEE